MPPISVKKLELTLTPFDVRDCPSTAPVRIQSAGLLTSAGAAAPNWPLNWVKSKLTVPEPVTA